MPGSAPVSIQLGQGPYWDSCKRAGVRSGVNATVQESILESVPEFVPTLVLGSKPGREAKEIPGEEENQ